MNRTGASVVVAGVVGGMLLASAFVVLFILLDTCDGDGGSPYSARDSVAGGFCHGPLDSVWAAVAFVAPPLTVLVLGIGAIRVRAWKRVAGALGAGIAVLIVLAGVVLALPSNCSTSDQRAYDAWLKAGTHGQPPADCDQY